MEDPQLGSDLGHTVVCGHRCYRPSDPTTTFASTTLLGRHEGTAMCDERGGKLEGRNSGAVGWRGERGVRTLGAFGYVGDTEIVLLFWKNGSDTRCLPLILERCGILLERSLKNRVDSDGTMRSGSSS
jgi:hypothetical protein